MSTAIWACRSIIDGWLLPPVVSLHTFAYWSLGVDCKLAVPYNKKKLGTDFLLSLQATFFPANGSVFKVFKKNTAKHNTVMVQQFRFSIQMVQFCVGFKFRTADCMGIVLWNMTPCDILNRPTVGLLYTILSLSLLWRFGPYSGHGLLYRGFTITPRHTAFGRTPLDEWSARRRDLYLTTQNTHKRQISMTLRHSNPQSQQSSCRKPVPEDSAVTGLASSLKIS